MPVGGFLSNTLSQFADKAQDALNKNPRIAQHIPSSISGRPSSTTPNEAGSSSKNSTLEQIQHQFRAFQVQHGYGNSGPVQRIVTSEKGVVLDFDAVKRDIQAQSKEIYMWGKADASEDLKDVTDRLAFLNYISGQLSGTLAAKLDAARAPLKALRDSDAQLAPRRNARANLQAQIDRLEQNKEKGYEIRIVELRSQLRKAEEDDAPQERESEILKRKAIRESEQLKFEALREYGEKLSLIAQASVPVLETLPSIPPSASMPYNGSEQTGTVRATLQHALDNWKPGSVTLMAPANAILDRSNTRAFGETHAAEISKINTEQAHEAAKEQHSPPVPSGTVAQPASPVVPSPRIHATVGGADLSTSPPINPSALNNSPAPIPVPNTPITASVPAAEPEVVIPPAAPTIAETGVPIVAKAEDPGPASGSLKDLRPSVTSTAEEEKRRLEREERERLLHAQGSSSIPVSGQTPAVYESAEDEKRRLEREERDRLLHGASPSATQGKKPEGEGDGPEAGPPPYQE